MTKSKENTALRQIHTRNDVTAGVPSSCVRLLSDTDSASNEADLNYVDETSVKECLKGLIELDDIKPSEEQQHALYRGVDLNLVYDIDQDSQVVFLDTFTKGYIELFAFYGSKFLTLLDVNKRFSAPLEGCPTFVRSTCMSKFPRLCCGCIISFSIRFGSSWTPYKLGIISALRYFVDGYNKHEMDFYEHIGDIDQDGIPHLLKCESWTSMVVHLAHRRAVSLNNIKFFFFFENWLR